MQDEEHHEQVLAISRLVDQVADEFLGDEPDWDPLHVVLPLEWCDGFMWMFRVTEGDAVIEMLTPIQARYHELMADRGELASLLHKGAEKARAVASVTLQRAYDAVGLLRP